MDWKWWNEWNLCFFEKFGLKYNLSLNGNQDFIIYERLYKFEKLNEIKQLNQNIELNEKKEPSKIVLNLSLWLN